jgi:hypothetical protein
MSASSLLNIEGDIFLPCAVSAPATSATLLQSGRGFSIVYTGEAVLPVATPSASLAVAVPGVLATDLVITTVNGSATPANLLLAVAGVATADTVTLTTGVVATNTLTVGFLVIRLN